MFTIGPNNRYIAEMVCDKYHEIVSSVKGFQRITYLFDDVCGEYGALSIWASKEASESAYHFMYPQIREAFGDAVKGSPDIRMLEVYVPNFEDDKTGLCPENESS
jgi:hypothetical protein